jgi:hypothetical protein
MELKLRNVPAGKATEVLAEKGVAADTPVTIYVGEDFATIAARMREYARQQGMTNELFEELMKDES